MDGFPISITEVSMNLKESNSYQGSSPGLVLGWETKLLGGYLLVLPLQQGPLVVEEKLGHGFLMLLQWL